MDDSDIEPTLKKSKIKKNKSKSGKDTPQEKVVNNKKSKGKGKGKNLVTPATPSCSKQNSDFNVSNL